MLEKGGAARHEHVKVWRILGGAVLAFRLLSVGMALAVILLPRVGNAAAAIDDLPRDRLPLEGLRNPDWIARPSGEDLARAYPKLASLLSLSGSAHMVCEVAADGSLRDCKIDKETPDGFGFGDASLSMVDTFKMRPMTFNEAPIDGASVAIPMNFKPADRAKAPLAQADGKPADPRLLTLSEQLVALDGESEAVEAALRQMLKREIGDEQPGQTKEVRAARAIVDSRVAQTSAQYVGERALAYAHSYSLPELRQLVAFYRSPVGRSWTQHNVTPGDGANQAMARAIASLTTGSREELCRQIGCLPADSAPAP